MQRRRTVGSGGRRVGVEAIDGEWDTAVRLAEESHGSIEEVGLVCRTLRVPSVHPSHLNVKVRRLWEMDRQFRAVREKWSGTCIEGGETSERVEFPGLSDGEGAGAVQLCLVYPSLARWSVICGGSRVRQLRGRHAPRSDVQESTMYLGLRPPDSSASQILTCASYVLSGFGPGNSESTILCRVSDIRV